MRQLCHANRNRHIRIDLGKPLTGGRGRLYPIPEPHDGVYRRGGLATSEGARGEPGEEGKPMANLAKGAIQRVHDWLLRYHMVLTVVLSMFHIGLASMPTRDSGRAGCNENSSLAGSA